MYFNLFFGESFSQQWRSRACIDTILRKRLSSFSWCFSIFFRCFFQFHQLFWESSTFSWCCTRAPSSSGVHQFFLEFFFFFRCWKRNTGFFFSFTRLSGSSPRFPGATKKPLSFLVFTSFFEVFSFLWNFRKITRFSRSSPLFSGVAKAPRFSGVHRLFPELSSFSRCFFWIPSDFSPSLPGSSENFPDSLCVVRCFIAALPSQWYD